MPAAGAAEAQGERRPVGTRAGADPIARSRSRQRRSLWLPARRHARPMAAAHPAGARAQISSTHGRGAPGGCPRAGHARPMAAAHPAGARVQLSSIPGRGAPGGCPRAGHARSPAAAHPVGARAPATLDHWPRRTRWMPVRWTRSTPIDRPSRTGQYGHGQARPTGPGTLGSRPRRIDPTDHSTLTRSGTLARTGASRPRPRHIDQTITRHRHGQAY